MRKVFCFVLLCAVVVMAGCSESGSSVASSDKYNYQERGCFEPMDLDANHDGELTTAEAVQFYTEEFYWFDQDDDGVIKTEEMVCSPEERVAIDANADGTVTKEEYVAYWSTHPCKCGQYT